MSLHFNQERPENKELVFYNRKSKCDLTEMIFRGRSTFGRAAAENPQWSPDTSSGDDQLGDSWEIADNSAKDGGGT